MFDRIISIDWSGAGTEDDRVDLRVAVWERDTNLCHIQLPDPPRPTRSWKRSELRTWLAAALHEPRRTLVAMDFALGLPWGSDQVIFETQGWRSMIRRIAELYAHHGTARATALAINQDPRFEGHGPYRFDDCRSDFRFYVKGKVAYYRLTELAAPQAISQWYLGSGGTVGSHTLTGLSALDFLIGLREHGAIKFAVWPFEAISDSRHVLVESYPALCPELEEYGAAQGGHEQDAWKVLQFLVSEQAAGRIADLFALRPLPFGRIDGVAFERQIEFEGAIIGIL